MDGAFSPRESAFGLIPGLALPARWAGLYAHVRRLHDWCLPYKPLLANTHSSAKSSLIWYLSALAFPAARLLTDATLPCKPSPVPSM